MGRIKKTYQNIRETMQDNQDSIAETTSKVLKFGLGLATIGALAKWGTTSVHIVRPNQNGLIELFGKYTNTVDAGLRIIPPWPIGRLEKIPMDLRRCNIPHQWIITKEQLNCKVDAVCYYKVVDPFKARYNVQNFQYTVPILAQTTLRNVLGTFTLQEANSQRKAINEQLGDELREHVKDWGMEIINVELQAIEPTDRVQHSMNDIIISDQERIAADNKAKAWEIEADGKRRVKVKEATGNAEAILLEGKAKADYIVLEAKAKAESIVLDADAKAKALQKECDAANQYFNGNVEKLYKYKTTVDALKDNTTLLMPHDSKMFNILDIAKIANNSDNSNCNSTSTSH